MFIVHLKDSLQIFYPVVYEDVLVLGDDLGPTARVEKAIDLGMEWCGLFILLFQSFHQV